MNWNTPALNLEAIYKYFLDFSFPISLIGPMKRDQLVDFCINNYSHPKDGDEPILQPFLTEYTTTANNTALSAMFKFGLLREDNKLINFTEAGCELFEGRITPNIFFKRQIIEYQFYNPYYTDCGESNVFNYWIILKFIRELGYIDYDDAKYVVLTLDNYDEKTFNDSIEKIKHLRSIKISNPDDYSLILDKEFPNKNIYKKAWQYERNYLKWTGFCTDSQKRSLKIWPDKYKEVDLLLQIYPAYVDYSNKSTYSDYVGRSFASEINYHLLEEDFIEVDETNFSMSTGEISEISLNDFIIIKNVSISKGIVGIVRKIESLGEGKYLITGNTLKQIEIELKEIKLDENN